MKKRVLITGGTGSVGRAFIKKFLNLYNFGIVGRDAEKHTVLKSEVPEAKYYLCSVENRENLLRVFSDFLPDIVIHLAAMKYVDFAEEMPINAIEVNVVGSLNVIYCSIKFEVPITVATSTDKACESKNVYGMTKYLMERSFLEANNLRTHFAICRFGNVAFSKGSVLPLWFKMKERGEPLKVTNPLMNRLMFSKKDAAELINLAVIMCENGDGGFVLCKKMKNVNILELAQLVSQNYIIVGPRPGEKIDEVLVSTEELIFSEVDGDFIKLRMKVNDNEKSRLLGYHGTQTAGYMSEDDVKKLIFEGDV